MKCPTCKDVALVISERQQIEIDYCPECRGVWLDRGELDKLIERSVKSEDHFSSSGDKYKGSSDDYKKEKYYKRKSFLSEIFD